MHVSSDVVSATSYISESKFYFVGYLLFPVTPLLVSAHEQEGLSSWTRTDTSDVWEFKQFFSWQSSMPRRGAEKCLVCGRKPVGTIVANRGICKRKAFARFRDLNLRVSNESHLFLAGKWHDVILHSGLEVKEGPHWPVADDLVHDPAFG